MSVDAPRPASHDRAPRTGWTRQARLLLDVLVGLSIVAALLQCLWLWDSQMSRWGDGLLAMTVLAVAVWLMRRRALAWSRVLTVVFVLISFAAAFVGDGLLASLMLLVALLLLVLDFGAPAGMAAVVAVAVVQAITMPMLGNSVENTIVQTLAMAILMTFGLLFALLLRQSEQSRHDKELLLAELDLTNRRLLAANRSLHHQIEVEKELVLAEERARSARDLHDGLGHRLILARMALDFVERVWARDPEQALAEVRTARTTTEEALDQMRLWVRALNPPRSIGRDGVAAFDDIAEAFRGTGLVVDVEVTGTERALPQDVSLVAYRFVQEGLTNALRHGRPQRVQLTIDYTADDVRLELRDDGATSGPVRPMQAPGATPPERPAEGFGLRSLRERAEACGGALSASRLPGGFGLSLRLPLPPEAAGPQERVEESGADPADRGAEQPLAARAGA